MVAGKRKDRRLTPVVADFDFKALDAIRKTSISNMVLEAVAVPVFDRVAHHLFDGKVGRKNNFGRGAVALENSVVATATREDRSSHSRILKARAATARVVARREREPQAFCPAEDSLR